MRGPCRKRPEPSGRRRLLLYSHRPHTPFAHGLNASGKTRQGTEALREAYALGLVFPLRNGTYYVAHGGNSPVINYHNVDGTHRYALGIARLGPYRTRAAGLYPRDPGAYAIFDDRLYSPCDGTVTHAVDGLPNLVPPESDREHPAGNHIILECDDYPGVKIVMAHLMNGSVAVKPGRRVRAGETIGRVGNSGSSTEPHLHIHAAKGGDPASPLDGAGVPITFGGGSW